MSVHFLVILHMFLFFRFSTVKQLNSLHIIRQKLIRYIHKKGKLKRVLIVCIVCMFYNVPKELLLLSLSKCALLVTNIKKNFILLLRLRRVRVRCLSQIVWDFCVEFLRTVIRLFELESSVWGCSISASVRLCVKLYQVSEDQVFCFHL